MRGETSVRSAEDLDSGALTYAEIKAIASGNPAVVEKIKIDTEIRKLDQLRAVHANQQRHIRWEIRDLPRHIAETKQRLAEIEGDIELRNSTEGADFNMTVGNRVFLGKGAREEAAKALTFTILSWRDDQTMQPRGQFRGFEILSKGRSGGPGSFKMTSAFLTCSCGRTTYSAKLNPVNLVGNDPKYRAHIEESGQAGRRPTGLKQAVARIEKELVDYQAQAERPFEHEERLKQLLTRQAELNSALDLDKGDQQGADSAAELKGDLDVSQTPTPAEPSRDQVAKMAEAYMRASKTAIREMPILQRTPPQTGPATGRAVAKDDVHIAVATAANSFFVVPSTSLGREVENRRASVFALSAWALRVWKTTAPEPDEPSRADVAPPPERLADRPPGVREAGASRRRISSFSDTRFRISRMSPQSCGGRLSNRSTDTVNRILSAPRSTESNRGPQSYTMKASRRRFRDTDCSPAGPVVSSDPSARMFGQRFA